MKDRILKLAKRLNKFTLDEISSIVETDEQDLKLILNNLEEIKRSGEIYLYSPPVIKKGKRKNSILKYQNYPQEELNLIVSAFCADVETYKVSLMLGTSRSCISNFYNDFKILIYKDQLNQLINKFTKTPRIESMHSFFTQQGYFYLYGSNLYISKEKLIADEYKKYSKKEMLTLKKIYARAKRKLINSVAFEKNFHYHIAEKIWRDEKSYEELFKELQFFLNFN